MKTAIKLTTILGLTLALIGLIFIPKASAMETDNSFIPEVPVRVFEPQDELPATAELIDMAYITGYHIDTYSSDELHTILYYVMYEDPEDYIFQPSFYFNFEEDFYYNLYNGSDKQISFFSPGSQATLEKAYALRAYLEHESARKHPGWPVRAYEYAWDEDDTGFSGEAAYIVLFEGFDPDDIEADSLNGIDRVIFMNGCAEILKLSGSTGPWMQMRKDNWFILNVRKFALWGGDALRFIFLDQYGNDYPGGKYNGIVSPAASNSTPQEEEELLEQNGVIYKLKGKTLFIDGTGQVESIAEIMGEKLKEVESVFLGENIREIKHDVLESEWPNISEFVVSKNNPYFFSDDGVLFSMKVKNDGAGKDVILKRYPQGKRGSYTIPEGTATIDNGAFRNCKYLESVTFPSEYSGEIPEFRKCTSLESINLMDDKSGYFSSDGVLYNKKYYYNDLCTLVQCPAAKEGRFVVPENVDWISFWAFEDCSLTEITITDNVWGIGDWAFQNSRKLEKITISGNVSSIYERAFRGCTNLREICIAQDNQYYQSIDGVIFDKELNRIICCPQAKTGMYEIPYGVNEIGLYAFNGSKLTSLFIPDSIMHIEFAGNGTYDGAFLNDPAPNVTDIYYQGTETEWNQIIVTPTCVTPGEVFQNAVIHFLGQEHNEKQTDAAKESQNTANHFNDKDKENTKTYTTMADFFK